MHTLQHCRNRIASVPGSNSDELKRFFDEWLIYGKNLHDHFVFGNELKPYEPPSRDGDSGRGALLTEMQKWGRKMVSLVYSSETVGMRSRLERADASTDGGDDSESSMGETEPLLVSSSPS
ncbi:hypothetical protein HGRIS_014511 [Hohenbuehelia grisea]|uniref:Uncharacterized protein n=1 Tax=Hohenbuehelia grisea TaxID=104357 RepID=A0ABR3JTU8_9AGAR